MCFFFTSQCPYPVIMFALELGSLLIYQTDKLNNKVIVPVFHICCIDVCFYLSFFYSVTQPLVLCYQIQSLDLPYRKHNNFTLAVFQITGSYCSLICSCLIFLSNQSTAFSLSLNFRLLYCSTVNSAKFAVAVPEDLLLYFFFHIAVSNPDTHLFDFDFITPISNNIILL